MLRFVYKNNILFSCFQASDVELIWVMRIAIFGVGALATVMAITVGSIYELWFLCSDFVYVMLFPQLTCVVYFNGTNTYGSLAGFIVGLFFRLAGGDSLMDIAPIIKYPWYIDTSNEQLFPFKTFAMILTFIFIFLVSYATNYIFKHGLLPKHCDVFQCIVNLPKEKPKTIFHPTQELEVQASSKETLSTIVDPINGELPPYYPNYSVQTKL